MKVYTIHRNGSTCCVNSIDEVLSELATDIEETYADGFVGFPDVVVSEMTQEAYDALPEFQGW